MYQRCTRDNPRKGEQKFSEESHDHTTIRLSHILGSKSMVGLLSCSWSNLTLKTVYILIPRRLHTRSRVCYLLLIDCLLEALVFPIASCHLRYLYQPSYRNKTSFCLSPPGRRRRCIGTRLEFCAPASVSRPSVLAFFQTLSHPST